jgi:hypothetical protein
MTPIRTSPVGEQVGALVVSGEYFFLTQRNRLTALAARHLVPTIYAYREFIEAGGLMSHGIDNFDARPGPKALNDLARTQYPAL